MPNEWRNTELENSLKTNLTRSKLRIVDILQRHWFSIFQWNHYKWAYYFVIRGYQFGGKPNLILIVHSFVLVMVDFQNSESYWWGNYQRLQTVNNIILINTVLTSVHLHNTRICQRAPVSAITPPHQPEIVGLLHKTTSPKLVLFISTSIKCIYMR